MLTEQEKSKIALEEQYRNEISKAIQTKSKIDLIETITKILQGLAIVVGIWATYFAYKKANDDRRAQELEYMRQTAKEFRKTFYEMQLQYYAEAAEATGTLSTEKIGTTDYINAKKNFNRLFWGRLSIVEESTVEARMVKFKKLLELYEQKNSKISQESLQQASLSLAHDASKYTINVWLDSAERKYYNR